mgnify:CR=1 FL=1|tara:strand:+ start:28610 stop:29500 length:891 start_codon:yes stop_codon:yes gene_type:complete
MSDYSPKHPFIVVDQNQCRKQQSVDDLIRRCYQQELGLLLPDTAIYEFSKGTKAYNTWRHSLELICKEPGLVFAGRSIGKMMNEEVATGTALNDVIDQEVTPRLRQLLTELKTGDDSRINKSLAEVVKFIDDEKDLREQHDVNKSIVDSLTEHWKSSLSDDDLKKLRQPDRETFVRILSQLETARIVFEAAKADGCSDEIATSLTVGPSVYGHVVLGLAALSLDWLAQGGLDGAKADKITNDFHDLDYICTATFCTDLVTDDRRANRVYSAMIDALERRWAKWKTLAEAEEGQSGS